MLKIKRVPTLVSNFQKDEVDEIGARGAGCGRNCLRNCCLPGTLYAEIEFFVINWVLGI